MSDRHPRRRRRLRDAARAGAAFSVAMGATTAWVSAESASPQAAAVGAGARIVAPDTGMQLDSGDANTPFTLDLPDGAACTGDTPNDAYNVFGYLISSAIDPATLEFDSEGPEPQVFSPQDAFQAPLFDTTHTPYASASTAPRNQPGGPGPIINLPAFHLATLVDPELFLPSGDYNVGIACWGPVGNDPVLDRFWNVEMTVVSADGDPPTATWSADQAVETKTTLAVVPSTQAAEGDAVTLTASVTPAEAAGTVTFLRDGVPIGSAVAVAAGSAVLATTELPAGTFDLVARFDPTTPAAFGPSESDPLTYTIVADEPIATTVTLAADPTAGAVEGDAVTLTATVAPGDAAGTVTFLDGATPIGSPVAVSAGSASVTTSDLAVGDHTLTASFEPASAETHAASTSAPIAYEVTADVDPPVGGGAAQVVSPESGSPLDSGDADTPFTLLLPVGAACSGDTPNDAYHVFAYMIASAIDPATLEFNGEGPVPLAFGEPQASFRAPLFDTNGTPYASASTAPANPPPGPGTIVNIPAFTLDTLVEPDLLLPSGDYHVGIACWGPVGDDPVLDAFWNVEMTVTATAGEPNTATWTADNETPIATTTTLAVAPATSAAAGDEVTLTATVAPTDAEGTVTFLDGAAAIGDPVTLAGGTAALTTSTLAVGTHTITARFDPASGTGFAPSTSAPVEYVITDEEPEPDSTSITLSVAPTGRIEVGEEVTLTATVSPTTAAGDVVFKDNGAELDGDANLVAALAVAVLSNGTATLRTSALTAGSHSLTATFDPTDPAAFAASTSPAVILDIAAQASTTTTSTSTTSTSTSTTLGSTTSTSTGATTSTTGGVGGAGLPRTGSAPGALVAWALLAIALGGAAVHLGRHPAVRTGGTR